MFVDGPYPDTGYQRRRQDNFIVAVNCGEAGGTCFCVSMNTGPKADAGFDLALTELLDGDEHRFLVEVGSAAGAEVLAELPHGPAAPEDIAAADAVVARTAGRMGRTLDTDGLKELLQGNPTHQRWDDVAARCLTCANCTMVCPTCFCTTVEDHTDLTGQTAERVRRWDSCFTLGFFLHPRRQRADRRQVALPAMDDAQARELDRPVRHLGLRRLRPLHHLVPGRHRHHRGGGGDPGRPRQRSKEADHGGA